jgi:hypothetical protein
MSSESTPHLQKSNDKCLCVALTHHGKHDTYIQKFNKTILKIKLPCKEIKMCFWSIFNNICIIFYNQSSEVVLIQYLNWRKVFKIIIGGKIHQLIFILLIIINFNIVTYWEFKIDMYYFWNFNKWVCIVLSKMKWKGTCYRVCFNCD